MPKLTGLILCGGQSSRMGTDKAHLSLNGQTLIERSRGRLAEVTDEVFTVGGEQGDILDRYIHAGPAVAIASAMLSCELAQADWLLVIPVDMPGLTSSFLSAFIAKGREENTSVYLKQQVLPLLLNANKTKAAKLLQKFEQQQTLSLRDAIQVFNAKGVTLTEFNEDEFANVNTPQEWASFTKRYGKG